MGDEQAIELTRNDKVHRLTGLVAELRRDVLKRHETTLGPMQRSAWVEKVRKVCDVIAPSWSPLVQDPTSQTTVSLAEERLLVLRDRIRRGASVELSDEVRAALEVSTRLYVWGDHIVDLHSGGGGPVDFPMTEDAKFVAELPAQLNAARVAVASTRWGAFTDLTLGFISGCVDEDALIPSNNAEYWHAGWALMTIAWWIADRLGDSLHVHQFPLCSFDEAARSRLQFLDGEDIRCPRCGVEAEIPQTTRVRLPSHLWLCNPCNLAGYFPGSTPPRSAWATFQVDAARIDPVSLDGPAAASPPDLSWMSHSDLQQIANDDFDEAERCVRAGAFKCALFAAGSACEAMLLDVLERNVVIAKTHLRRPEDWPDRVSLEVMIAAALDEGIITDSHAAAARAITAHRDLVHPNRVRAARITVDDVTARMLVLAALGLARDLRAATNDNRVAAFAAKQLGHAS